MANVERSIFLESLAVGLDTFPSLTFQSDLNAIADNPLTKFMTVGAKYTVAAPTYTDGTLGTLRVTSDGKLLVSTGQAGGVSDVNIFDSNGAVIALGQTTMAASLPVTFASNQSALSTNAAQSGTWNITNISGTISLPTGAATSALQTTGNTSLASIDSKLGTLGQKTSAGSAPVVLASDQSAIPVFISSSSTALTPTSGQPVVGAGPTEAALGSGQADKILVIAKIGNAHNIYLGPTGVTSSNGLEMEPGREVPLENVNLSNLFINGTAGEGVSWVSLT